MHIKSHLPRLGLVGFGEVGQIFARDLLTTRAFSQINAWDIQFAGQANSILKRECQKLGITACNSVKDLAQHSDFIISAVTAANTLKVATQIAMQLRPGTVFLDLNSASPGTKRQAAKLVELAGGIYVEAGVMTSVPPFRIKVPCLLGGKQAAKLSRYLNTLGMNTQVASNRLGIASAIKMCRSIMIKGLEAIVIESFTTARSYGVEQEMIASLSETFPQINWQQQGSYFFMRVAKHGKRRAEEMRESAKTVAEAGIEPLMAEAIAGKQAKIAAHNRANAFANTKPNATWQQYADAMIQLKNKQNRDRI
jgi:3-hydroxyisobutyrate dehydrogenase-like beta-hydroxyacid dehydrogenase